MQKQKSNHRKIVGFDISTERIKELNQNFDRTKEVHNDDIKNSEIIFTNDSEYLKNADVFIVTVPTPIDDIKVPDLNPLKNATKEISKALKKRSKETKSIVIFESTVFPGATEEICIPILEQISELKLNKDFCCGFSPERIKRDKEHRLNNIKKVTSGSDKESSEWIDSFYASFISAGTHKAPNIKVAEAAKIIENTQRDINIALINELAMLFKEMNIDTLDVLEAAEKNGISSHSNPD